MSNVVTLDSIRKAAEAKYGSMIVPLDNDYEVELLNVLKLSREKRDAVMDMQGRLDEDKTDQQAVMEDILRLVAKTPAQAEALIEAIADDLTVLAEVFAEYSKGTQVGEASASQD